MNTSVLTGNLTFQSLKPPDLSSCTKQQLCILQMSGSSETSSDFLFLSYICCVHQQACVDRTSEGES